MAVQQARAGNPSPHPPLWPATGIGYQSRGGHALAGRSSDERGGRKRCQVGMANGNALCVADNIPILPTRTRNCAHIDQNTVRTKRKVNTRSEECPPKMHLPELAVDCSRLLHRDVPGALNVRSNTQTRPGTSQSAVARAGRSRAG